MDDDELNNSTNGDQISVGDVRDNVAVAIGRGAKAIVNIFSSEREGRDRRNLLTLLDKVNSFWVQGVLENSVHNATLIELGKQTQVEAIERPWEIVLSAVDEPNRILLPSQKIVDIYKENGRALLILGEPGSGKTMTLLELARDLVAQAMQDPSVPIPVVLNLSSWSEKGADFLNWLVTELNVKYQIPRKMGRYWIENDVLALLLDGLDEVKAEQRNSCVDAINQFRQQYGLTEMVVCSRTKEYDELKNRLKLNSAILIQPLTPEQIDHYLVSGGTSLAGLRHVMQTDAGMQQLAQSPLMLSIMSLVYQGLPVDKLMIEKIESDQHRNRLFDSYVQKMFARTARTRQGVFPEEQTISRLSWLARRMDQHNQAVFLIEQIQPSWLSSKLQQWFYLLISRSVCGLLIGFPIGLIFLEVLGLNTGILSGIIGGIVAGIVTGLRLLRGQYLTKNQRLTRHLQSSNTIKTLMNVLSILIGVGLSTFIIFFISYSQVFPFEPGGVVSFMFYGAITESVSMATLVGIIFGILFGIKADGQDLRQDIQTIEALSWSWKLAIQRAKKGAYVGLVIGLIVGLIAYPIFHYSFRSMTSILAEENPSLQNLVEMNNELSLISVICFVAPLIGIFGSIISLVLGGLFGGLQPTLVQTKARPNDGVRLSIRNAVVITLFTGLPIGLIVGLIGGANLAGLAITVLIIGLPVFLWYGGLAITQHYTLRVILYFEGSIPWNYTRFLDYAVERIFLRKVGGSYIFIHRFLQEYFASLTISSSTLVHKTEV
jgi:DNA polymerase III delta prime subunit